MRTLSAGLLAAQKAMHLQPYVKAVATAGATTYTLDNQGHGGAEKRILGIEHTEEAYGGMALIACRNEDGYFSTKNLRGFSIDIGYGAEVGASFEASNTAPLFVWSQRDVTYGGVQATELLCLDLWWQIAANMVIWAGERINGTISNIAAFKLGELITGSPSGATGILIGVGYENILVTDVTGTFATDTSVSGASGSVAVTSVDVITAASGAAYGKNKTIKQIIEAILPLSISGVTLDSDDPDSTINTYKPLLVTDVGTKARGIIRQLLQMSGCGARMENDSRLHILYLDDAASAQYTYQTDHVFWYQMRERAVIMPNAVVFVDMMPDHLGNTPSYVGTAKHQPSIDLIGEFSDIQVNSGIEANGDVAGGAERFAKYWIAQRAAESYQGAVRAPMHCGQELYDMISIVHPTTGISVKGRVGRIDRRYKPGTYEIELRLGGIQTSPDQIPGFDVDTDIKDLDRTTWPVPDPDRVDVDWPDWSLILPKAVQGYTHDIKFTSTAYNKMSWTAGTIKFYDGTTQPITANTEEILPTTGSPYPIIYVYFDLDHVSPNVLKTVEAGAYLSTAMSEHTSVLCVAQAVPNTGANPLAIVLPGWEKQPLIVTDMIHMAGIKDWTDPVTGGHFHAILDTQIQAGSIKISGDTYFLDGYNPTHKGKTFHTTPTTPYNVGDIWIDDKIVKYCTTARQSGSFVSGDWTNSTKHRLASTHISDGALYLSSVIEETNYQTVTGTQKTSWNTVTTKTRTFRQTTAPSSGMVAGDIWINTADGDKPYTYSGSAWIASYTKIDGGNITTGTISCQVVTIQTASSGDRVRLNSTGGHFYGTAILLYTTAGTVRGDIESNSSALIIWGTPELEIQSPGKIILAGSSIELTGNYCDLTQRQDPPTTADGRSYYPTSGGSGYGRWRVWDGSALTWRYI